MHFITYCKYKMNFKFKMSVVSMKLFVVHCVTGGVSVRLVKTAPA